ncbi:MAG: hypothetical protein ACI9UT_001922 [Flavobacteriales bacterium]|jgi:hypothetical protein
MLASVNNWKRAISNNRISTVKISSVLGFAEQKASNRKPTTAYLNRIYPATIGYTREISQATTKLDALYKCHALHTKFFKTIEHQHKTRPEQNKNTHRSVPSKTRAEANQDLRSQLCIQPKVFLGKLPTASPPSLMFFRRFNRETK